MPVFFLSLSVFLLVLQGCVTSRISHVPAQNIVMFDGEGIPIDPTGNVNCAGTNASPLCHRDGTTSDTTHVTFFNYPQLSDRDYEATYLDSLFACMREYLGTAPAPPSPRCAQNPSLPKRPTGSPDVKRLFIFVHGGLNTQIGSVQRATDLYRDVAGLGYYPIFINWHSSFTSSYLEQLAFVRQGEKQATLGLATLPASLGVDIARAIARAPLVWAAQTAGDAKTLPGFSGFLDPRDPDTVAKELICAYEFPGANECPKAFRFKPSPLCLPMNVRTENGKRDFNRTESLSTTTFPISVGDDERDCFDMMLSLASYGITFPSRLLLEAAVDAFGTSAWENMLRRTRLLFNIDEEFVRPPWSRFASDLRYVDLPRAGGISIFLRKLRKAIESDQDGRPWEITLAGHSMGAIIISQMLREIMQLGIALPVKKIVFMGAAASVRDFQDSILPYLRTDPDATFYNLMLHPVAEQRESYQVPGVPILPLDPGPRGSLLVMIDNFLARPLTYLDRTVGRYVNFMSALHAVPAELRPRINVKVFSAGMSAPIRAANPQAHGDFTARFKFWIEDCWRPAPAVRSMKAEDCMRD